MGGGLEPLPSTSEGKMPLPGFHKYPLTFEEMVELGQDPGPSAPLFEEGSSIDVQDDPPAMNGLCTCGN